MYDNSLFTSIATLFVPVFKVYSKKLFLLLYGTVYTLYDYTIIFETIIAIVMIFSNTCPINVRALASSYCPFQGSVTELPTRKKIQYNLIHVLSVSSI